MRLQQEFWDEFGHELMVDDHNAVVFTTAGRLRYAPLFSKWGYVLASIKSVSEFKRVLRRVNAFEFDENNSKLAACLRDPAVPESEKNFIRQFLGPNVTASLVGKPAAAARPAVTQDAGTNVLVVDFKSGKARR